MANDTTTEPLTRARRKTEAELRVASWLEDYRRLWEANFQRLDALLEELQAVIPTRDKN